MNFKFLTLAFLALIAFSSCETEQITPEEELIVAQASFQNYTYYHVSFDENVDFTQYATIRNNLFNEIGYGIEWYREFEDNTPNTEIWRVPLYCGIQGHDHSDGVKCPDSDGTVRQEIGEDDDVNLECCE